MLKAEEAIKKKLNVKYVGAKRLIAEAKQNLNIADGSPEEEERFDEIIEEANNIFEDDLTEQEQKEMRIPEVKQESDVVRKAREAAEKRERQWAAEEQERQRIANGGDPAAAAAAAASEEAPTPEQPATNSNNEEVVIQNDGKTIITETTTTIVGPDGVPKTRTVRTVKTIKPVKVPKGEATSTDMTCACNIL